MKNYLLVLSVVMLFSCKHKEPEPIPEATGKMVFKITHNVDNQSMAVDTFRYVNAAGNLYQISELQYFISDVILNKTDGGSVRVDGNDWIHYVDTDIPSTQTWNISQNISATSYSSISFTFGITNSKNISYMFPNPPERDMFWPEYLGGGYHALKFNGKYKDTANLTKAFNYHLGRGQIYDTNGTIVGFVSNEFNVVLPGSAFTLSKDATKEIQLIMNIEYWFKPIIFDFNVIGGSIMQNQSAMLIARQNGAGVFSVGYIN
jgi:hypothetical protein